MLSNLRKKDRESDIAQTLDTYFWQNDKTNLPLDFTRLLENIVSLFPFHLQYSEMSVVFNHTALDLTVAQLNWRPYESFREIMSHLSPSVIAFTLQWLNQFWMITQARTGTEASMARHQKLTKHFHWFIYSQINWNI